jgi:hypothetical protein
MRRWKPYVCWVCLVLALLLVAVVVSIEAWHAYNYRRMAQKAADIAALAGRRALVRQYTDGVRGMSDAQVKVDMNEYAGRFLRICFPYDPDVVLDNVVGIYLDADGNALGQVGARSPEGAKGIQAVVHLRAPTVLGRHVGLDAWSLEAVATALFEDPFHLPITPPGIALGDMQAP